MAAITLERFLSGRLLSIYPMHLYEGYQWFLQVRILPDWNSYGNLWNRESVCKLFIPFVHLLCRVNAATLLMPLRTGMNVVMFFVVSAANSACGMPGAPCGVLFSAQPIKKCETTLDTTTQGCMKPFSERVGWPWRLWEWTSGWRWRLTEGWFIIENVGVPPKWPKG